MPKLSEAFASNWLKAGDLNGRRITASIDYVQFEKVGDDNKLVAYFRGKEKGLVLNRTNAEVIGAALGDDTDDWAGQQIELYPTKVPYAGKIVDAIRVDAKPPRENNGGNQGGGNRGGGNGGARAQQGGQQRQQRAPAQADYVPPGEPVGRTVDALDDDIPF